ncbi:hypothetical protein [Klebsiella aerogenes]|uniref:Acb2/Tad1 domain-containing protein n=1 Tax=Klebsiella aerogenes TaxID=548 RepID=UPI00351D0236
MSEAKPQDGSTVKGYRQLSPADIEQMNDLKDVSREFIQLLNFLGDTTDADRRWLALAKTEMQKACMSACRAVAQPEDDC